MPHSTFTCDVPHAVQESPPMQLPTQAQVDWAMKGLVSLYQMDVEQFNHVEWLMTTGLILPREGRRVVDALGYEPIGQGLHSPTDRFEQAPSLNGSVSLVLPEPRLEVPPPPPSLPASLQPSLPQLPPMPNSSQALVVPAPALPLRTTTYHDISTAPGSPTSQPLPLRDQAAPGQPASRIGRFKCRMRSSLQREQRQAKQRNTSNH